MQLPRESCSAQPKQSSERPNLLPDKKLFQLFSFLSAVSPVYGECLPKHASDWGREDSISQRANCQVGRLSEQPLQISFLIAGPGPFSIVACSSAFWCSAVKSSNRYRQEVFHASGLVRACNVTVTVHCDHAIGRSEAVDRSRSTVAESVSTSLRAAPARCMHGSGHARLNVLKRRAKKWGFFAEKLRLSSFIAGARLNRRTSCTPRT